MASTNTMSCSVTSCTATSEMYLGTVEGQYANLPLCERHCHDIYNRAIEAPLPASWANCAGRDGFSQVHLLAALLHVPRQSSLVVMTNINKNAWYTFTTGPMEFDLIMRHCFESPAPSSVHVAISTFLERIDKRVTAIVVENQDSQGKYDASVVVANADPSNIPMRISDCLAFAGITGCPVFVKDSLLTSAVFGGGQWNY